MVARERSRHTRRAAWLQGHAATPDARAHCRDQPSAGRAACAHEAAAAARRAHRRGRDDRGLREGDELGELGGRARVLRRRLRAGHGFAAGRRVARQGQPARGVGPEPPDVPGLADQGAAHLRSGRHRGLAGRGRWPPHGRHAGAPANRQRHRRAKRDRAHAGGRPVEAGHRLQQQRGRVSPDRSVEGP